MKPEKPIPSLIAIACQSFSPVNHRAIATVTHNPYQLAVDIYGIGFLTADKIARDLGVSPWSKFRYSAGILHILSKAAEDRHCFLPQSLLIETALELLTIEEHQTEVEGIIGVLNEMVSKNELIVEREDEPIYYKPSFFHTEQNLAKLLKQHLTRVY